MHRLKAIIFDCFGVLVEASLEPFYGKYFGNDTEKLLKAKSLANESNVGRITYEAFVVELAKLAQIPTNTARQFLDTNPPNIKLMGYIRDELRSKYKIGFLSNASDNWLNELFTPEQLSLFDDIVLSFQHKMAKPDSAIFRLAAQRLNIEPADCLLVDDVEGYCAGAREAGMQALCYTSLQQLKDMLAKIESSS
jgi:HAD superfamily hydrolase (TIGR01509 family)